VPFSDRYATVRFASEQEKRHPDFWQEVSRNRAGLRSVLRVTSSFFAISTLLWGAPAHAQTTSAPSLPDELITDENGYDLVTKGFQIEGAGFSLGRISDPSLDYRTRYYDNAWHSTLTYHLQGSTYDPGSNLKLASVAATLGYDSVSFYTYNGQFKDLSGTGATLVNAGGGIFILTEHDGTKITFDNSIGCVENCAPQSSIIDAYPTKIERPNGRVLSFHYKSEDIGTYPLIFHVFKPLSITTNDNYEIKYNYPILIIQS